MAVETQGLKTRVKSTNRFRGDQSIEQIANPGERLYQRGLKMEHEKQKLIEKAKNEIEEITVISHCTFQPKLQTQGYFKK